MKVKIGDKVSFDETLDGVDEAFAYVGIGIIKDREREDSDLWEIEVLNLWYKSDGMIITPPGTYSIFEKEIVEVL